MEVSHDMAMMVAWKGFAINEDAVDIIIQELAEPFSPVIPPADELIRNRQDDLRSRLRSEAMPDPRKAFLLAAALKFREQVGTPVTRDGDYSSSDLNVQ